jgi:PAS domain S-box-containing protein
VPREFEREHTYADGTTAHFALRLHPHPEGLFIHSVDVTERRATHDALRKSEASLREAQRIASVGSWEVDLRTGRRHWSEEMFRIFGRDASMGPPARDELARICDERSMARLAEAIQTMSARGSAVTLELHITRPDGVKRWVVLRGEAIVDAQHQVTGLRGTVQDVTERRTAEDDARALRDEVHAIVQASPVPIVATDLQGNVTLWSAAATRTFGWTPDEVVGRPLPLVPADKQGELDLLRSDASKGDGLRSFRTVQVTREGRRVPVSLSTSALWDLDGSPAGIVAVVVDLSEQSALRHALAESEQRFAATFEASPIAKLLIRIADRSVVETNRAYMRLSGLSRAQVVSSDVHSLGLVADPSEAERFWALALERPNFSDQHVGFKTASGQRGDALASGEQLSLHGEEFLLVVIQDITERKRAELALKESELRLRQLAESIDAVFWLMDVEKHKIIYLSPAYERVWGQSVEAVYADALAWTNAILECDRERVMEAARRKLLAGVYDEEYRIVRPDGSIRWVRDRAFPVRDGGGSVVLLAGSAQDITDRRELEAQLRQAQKMESFGHLASGVAHDFNNMLTVIQGNCRALSETCPEASEVQELLGEMQGTVDRAAALTRQLLAFSRKEGAEVQVVDLRSVVTGAETMLRRLLGEDMVLTLAMDAEPLPVRVDPASWVQVLMNLAVNARDAMTDRGELRVECSGLDLSEEFVRGRPNLKEGPHAMLSVTDTGGGIPPEVQARLFEPFFTTKEQGKGTGMGLFVTHGIVTHSGGHIELVSNVGQGTTFRIYLPLKRQPISEPQPVARVARATGGSETILVVEDEASIRRITARTLRKEGYTVLEACDGVEALEVVQGHVGPIHLVLTDVVMPRMDGRKLAEALHQRDANIGVVYTSGYNDDAVLRHGIEHELVAFLPKPYDLDGLRRKVRDVLDDAR